MSENEILRLAAVLREQPALLEACSRATSLGELGNLLRTAGFDVSENEVAGLFLPPSEMPDNQLDAVAGGEDGGEDRGIVFYNGWRNGMTQLDWAWRHRLRGGK